MQIKTAVVDRKPVKLLKERRAVRGLGKVEYSACSCCLLDVLERDKGISRETDRE